jgi:hypothetical protein
MGLRDVLRRLKREASEDAVVIRQRDGSVKTFDRMDVLAEMYLARVDAALGRPRSSSDVLDALEGATPESRRAVEEMSAGGFTADLEPRDPSAPPVEDLSTQAKEDA